MGDTEDTWRTKPFQMSVDGLFWESPPVPRKKTQDKDQDRERERARMGQSNLRDRERDRAKIDSKVEYKTGRQLELARERERGSMSREVQLSDTQYDKFSDLLRSLTLERHQVNFLAWHLQLDLLLCFLGVN
jgi:hypothetical protein